MWCFNEAGAMNPGIPASCSMDAPASPSFNEAGAMNPGIQLQLRRQDRVIPLASMRPGL